jgi:hypothetical protein
VGHRSAAPATPPLLRHQPSTQPILLLLFPSAIPILNVSCLRLCVRVRVYLCVVIAPTLKRDPHVDCMLFRVKLVLNLLSSLSSFLFFRIFSSARMSFSCAVKVPVQDCLTLVLDVLAVYMSVQQRADLPTLEFMLSASLVSWLLID